MKKMKTLSHSVLGKGRLLTQNLWIEIWCTTDLNISASQWEKVIQQSDGNVSWFLGFDDLQIQSSLLYHKQLSYIKKKKNKKSSVQMTIVIATSVCHTICLYSCSSCIAAWFSICNVHSYTLQIWGGNFDLLSHMSTS